MKKIEFEENQAPVLGFGGGFKPLNFTLKTKLDMNENVNLKNENPTFGNVLLVVVKWIGRNFGHVWCLLIHGLIRDKHKMHKAYGPEECQLCGRWWSL